MFYPVLTLSAEIVSEIFLHSIPPYPHYPPMLGPSSPTKLGQICSYWRQIAHSTPHLWRAFSLSRVGSRRRETAQLAAARIWLQRSGALPLSLAYEERMVSVGSRECALSILRDTRERWGHLYFDAFSADDGASGQLFEGHAPHLVALHVLLVDTSPSSAPRRLRSPNLQSAILRAPGDSRAISLPWAQLTTLFLTEVSLTRMVDILEKAPALVQCRLTIHAELARQPLFDPPVLLLPTLETLILQLFAEDDTPPMVTANVTLFVRALSTPALRRLHIEEDAFGGKPELVRKAVRPMGWVTLQELRVAYAQDRERSLAGYKEIFPRVAQISVNPPPAFSPEWGKWSLWKQSRESFTTA